jgi:ABC-type oligopeptide transport system substrate-binding subunit
MVYTKNDKYYDAAHVYVDRVEKIFYSSALTDPSTTRTWYENGLIDSFSVNAKDEEGWNKYVAGTEGTGTQKNPASELCNGILNVGDATYIGYYNFDRTYFDYNDNANAKTDAQKAATQKAVANANFRKGFLYSLNVIEYLKTYDPVEPFNWLMRAYTNRELDAINGKDYSDFVDEVFNEKQGTTGVSLTGIKNGSDPVYDAEKGAQFFQAAKAELIAAGLTEADFPIKIDVVGSMNLTTQTFETAMYAGIQLAGAGVVEIVTNTPQSEQQEVEWASLNANYDFSLWSGWGPDYADPQTFLETCSINGSMVEYFGFDGHDEENFAIQEAVLGEYDALYKAAIAITDASQKEARYEAMAEAEYNLIFESAIIIPWLAQNGYSASVANTVPYQAGRASYGLTADKLKNVVVVDQTVNPITKEVRAAVVAAYEAAK